MLDCFISDPSYSDIAAELQNKKRHCCPYEFNEFFHIKCKVRDCEVKNLLYLQYSTALQRNINILWIFVCRYEI